MSLKETFQKATEKNPHCELCEDETEDETKSHLLKCNPDLEQEIVTIKLGDIFNDLDFKSEKSN